MTLDDLARLICETQNVEGFKCTCPMKYEPDWCNGNRAKAQARAVVAALREVICDNVYMTQECCGRGVGGHTSPPECCCNPVHSITRDNLIMSFNDILGNAGNEKAAGGTSREGVAPEGVSPPCSTPAADPSPVCEWTRDEHAYAYEPECDWSRKWMYSEPSTTPETEGYNFCPSCGLPIKFKEPAHD